MKRERPLPFDLDVFLSQSGRRRCILHFREKQIISSQGELAKAVFYVQKGKVKLTVVSKHGKQAVVGILNAGDFFGEGCIAGQPFRTATASALTDCSLFRIEKQAMHRLLHERPDFSERFVAYLVSRNIRYEANLVDQLFDSSEKRLARTLLRLAHFGREGKPERIVPKISQETLAQMVGTTRSRVNYFMNKFRKLGFLDYDGSSLEVRSSLLNVVLHD